MEAIIFIGIQATGKSTFYQQHFYKTHIRLNLDMLKTRHRETILLNACIQAKQPFVIDNTNPLKENRQKYIEAAKKAGFTITGYYFQSKISDAIARNNERNGKECIPVPAILGTHKKLEQPDYQEGFDTLYYVKPLPNKTFIMEDYKDEI